MEDNSNSTNQYVLNFGLKAQLFIVPFIILMFGFCVLFWFISFVYFYLLLFVTSLMIIFWILYSIKTKTYIYGNSIEVYELFQKKRIFNLEKIDIICTQHGILYFFFDDGEYFTLYFFVKNLNRLISDANTQKGIAEQAKEAE